MYYIPEHANGWTLFLPPKKKIYNLKKLFTITKNCVILITVKEIKKRRSEKMRKKEKLFEYLMDNISIGLNGIEEIKQQPTAKIDFVGGSWELVFDQFRKLLSWV